MVDETQPADRRGAPRQAMVYRPILIEVDQLQGFFLVRNISETGMMGQFYTRCGVDTPVRVHVGEALVVTGAVIWSDGLGMGIKFDTEVNVSEILARMSRPSHEGKVQRALRVNIAALGHIVSNGRTVPVETIDISQKGVKLRSPYLQKGDEVVVSLDGLEPRMGLVRWARGGTAGLNFIRPLSFDSLSMWVIEQQSGSGPSSSAAPAFLPV